VHHTVTRRAQTRTCNAPSALALAQATRDVLVDALRDNACYKSLRKPLARIEGDSTRLERIIQDAAAGRTAPRWLPWSKTKRVVA
jgi:hypothetical protein